MKLVTESSQILWNSFIFSQQSTGWAAKAAQDDNSDCFFEYNLGIHNQIDGKKIKNYYAHWYPYDVKLLTSNFVKIQMLFICVSRFVLSLKVD